METMSAYDGLLLGTVQSESGHEELEQCSTGQKGWELQGAYQC